MASQVSSSTSGKQACLRAMSFLRASRRFSSKWKRSATCCAWGAPFFTASAANGRYTLPQRQLSPSDLAGQLSSSDCSELEIVLLLPDVSSSQKMTSPFDMLSHLISSLWSSLRGTGLSLPIARQVSPSFFRIAASSSFRIGQGQSHFCRKRR